MPQVARRPIVSSVTEHHLTRADARRIAVLAQLLDARRPGDLEEVVGHLTLLQSEPTAAVAPSAEVVAWSRLGPAHPRGGVEAAVEEGRLIELRQMLRLPEDLALYRAEMAAWPGAGGEPTEWEASNRDWVEANDETRRDILAKLYDDGPLPSSELPDTTLVPWESSGWNNDRNIRMLLGLMVQRGEVAVAGYAGRDKLWDLAERVYPDVEPVPLAAAPRIRAERVLASQGRMRGKTWTSPGESLDTRTVGEPARVEGVRGTWRVDPGLLDVALEPRVALLSPLDRLVFDRKRMEELFGFDYQLEQYKPAAKRRWGYWAMPVLDGDRLVGKVDATSERDRGVLRVDAVHEDEPFAAGLAAGVRRELESLAAHLGLVLEGPD